MRSKSRGRSKPKGTKLPWSVPSVDCHDDDHLSPCVNAGQMPVAQNGSLCFLGFGSESGLGETRFRAHTCPLTGCPTSHFWRFTPHSSSDRVIVCLRPALPCPALKLQRIGSWYVVHVAGSVNVSRSIRNMILDSIYESQNFGKGWLGYNIMPRAPTAVFVELLICISLVVASVMTPLTKKLVQKLWQQRQITGHVPMFVGKPQSHEHKKMWKLSLDIFSGNALPCVHSSCCFSIFDCLSC